MASNNFIASNIFRICIWGDSAVGKTLLAHRLVNKEIPYNYIPTLGVDFLFKIIPEHDVKIYIWDLGGDLKLDEICIKYLSSSDLVLLVYNQNNNKTINRIDKIIAKYLDNKNYLLVNNVFREKENLLPHTINAKENINVNIIFDKIIQTFIEKNNENKKKLEKNQISNKKLENLEKCKIM